MPGDLPVPNPLDPQTLLLIDALCDRFEAELQAGRHADLGPLLESVAEEARPELFRGLLELEIRYRQQAGRPLTAGEAGQRFGALGSWVGDVLESFGLAPG